MEQSFWGPFDEMDRSSRVYFLSAAAKRLGYKDSGFCFRGDDLVDLNGNILMNSAQLLPVARVIKEEEDQKHAEVRNANLASMSPLRLLEHIEEAKKQRDSGLYPMLDVDGHQIYAQGTWQWVPAAKKDWRFNLDGNPVDAPAADAPAAVGAAPEEVTLSGAEPKSKSKRD